MRLAQPDDDVTSRGLSPEHRCDHGWLGYDAQDRKVPCLVCRPHLKAHMERRAGVRAQHEPVGSRRPEGSMA